MRFSECSLLRPTARRRRRRRYHRPPRLATVAAVGAISALLWIGRPAQGHSARFAFAATVMDFHTSLPVLTGRLQNGDTLRGTLAYELDFVDEAADPQEGLYREPTYMGWIRLRASHGTFVVRTVENPQIAADGAFIMVQNRPEFDSLTIFTAHVDTSPSIVGLPGVDFVDLQINLVDSTGSAWNSDALPDTLELSMFDSAVLGVFAEDFAGTGNPLVLEAVLTELAPVPILRGDYNANDAVEQADLDLVLLNWGRATPPIPRGWINDLPRGTVDQEELDKLLLNWGVSFSAQAAAAVPEPSSIVLAAVVLLLAHALSLRGTP